MIMDTGTWRGTPGSLPCRTSTSQVKRVFFKKKRENQGERKGRITFPLT